MDTLTHALSGALLARAVAPYLPKESTPPLRRVLLIGALSAAFPDSDVIISLVADQLTYLNLHRGVTHSLILLPLWALLLTALFTGVERNRRHARSYLLLAMAGIAIHIGGDVITTYGTQILSPFSIWKASLPYTFIIDLWFSGIIIAGLLASWRWRTSCRPAQFALLVLVGYVGFQAYLSSRAVAVGEAYARQQGFTTVEVAALPQPLSPFNWKLIVSTGDHYEIAYINLRRDSVPAAPSTASGFFAKIDALYQPQQVLHWQREARFGEAGEQEMLSREVWNTPVMARVRRFIEYPALAQISGAEVQGTCVWFDDLRFTLANVRTPFRFGACRRDQHSDWQLFRKLGDKLVPL